jgi:uncharacterized protein
VIGLTRRPREDGFAVRWRAGELTPAVVSGGVPAWADALGGCHAVVHLAGEPIGDRRWNEARKAAIRASRIDGTRALVEALASVGEARPRVLVAANGSDYYPFDESDTAWREDGAPGQGFLAELCVAWQAEAERAERLGMRVVTMRTGIVLSARGGAFPRLVTPFKLFAGGRIGNGRRWFSWVHVADVVRAYLRAIDDAKLSGPVNLVAPEPVRGSELARRMGAALRRPSWLPVPAFAIKLAAGGIAPYLTHGRQVVPAKLQAAGFEFSHPDLASALDDLVAREGT